MVIAQYVDGGETIKLPPSHTPDSGAFAHSPEEPRHRFLDTHFPDDAAQAARSMTVARAAWGNDAT